MNTTIISLIEGGIEQMKRYAEEILQRARSTIQVKPYGTVIVTPHPRQLPNEILAQIVNYVIEQQNRHCYLDDSRQTEQRRDLYTCTLVSKQFYAIANPLLWQEPVLDVEPTHLRRLLDCLAGTQQPLGCYVRRLLLHNSFCTDNELLLLMTHIRHLETLEIENVTYVHGFLPITRKSLQHLPSYCSHLTSLGLFNIDLSEATIHAIGQHCHRLRKLTLYPSLWLWDDTLSALSSCPLEMLSLRYCELVGPLPEKMVMDLTRFHGLTLLRMNGFEPSKLIMTLTNNIHDKNDDGAITVSWPRLETLYLDHCDGIDDTTFICFIKSHPLLQFIRLSDANLTDASMDAMAGSLPDITTVFFTKVNGISSDAVRRLIRNCKKLVLAHFDSCDQILKRHFLESDEDSHYLRLDERDIGKIRRAQGTGEPSMISQIR